MNDHLIQERIGHNRVGHNVVDFAENRGKFNEKNIVTLNSEDNSRLNSVDGDKAPITSNREQNINRFLRISPKHIVNTNFDSFSNQKNSESHVENQGNIPKEPIENIKPESQSIDRHAINNRIAQRRFERNHFYNAEMV